MGEWHVLWEVVVLGTLDRALELIRQNAAVGWMMLSMVEGISRSEGGVGTLLLNMDKHQNIAMVFAIQLTILAVGLLQDVGLARLRITLCPYVALERGGK
jgi:NitT/TauT family transport system permease protein